MTKMHNRYRKAKRFTLDEDGEVNDEFSGNHRAHLRRDWDYYDYKRNSLWKQHHNAGRKFIESRVGQRWNDVHSAFTSRANSWGGYVARYLKDQIDWNVEFQVEVREDGVYLQGRWGYTKLNGGMYVHPVTGILSRVPRQKVRYGRYNRVAREQYERHQGRMVVMVDGLEFVRYELEHKRRVAPGVFEVDKQLVWYKFVPYEHTMKWNTWERNEEGKYIYETRTETRWRKYGATKQEIKQHNLTYENT